MAEGLRIERRSNESAVMQSRAVNETVLVCEAYESLTKSSTSSLAMSSGQEQLCIWYLNPIFYAPQSLLFHCSGHIESLWTPSESVQFCIWTGEWLPSASAVNLFLQVVKSVPHLLGMLPLGPVVKIKFEGTVFLGGEKQAPIFFMRDNYKLLISSDRNTRKSYHSTTQGSFLTI